jgi:hypothetical protein
LESRSRWLAVAGVVLGLGAASGVAAGSSLGGPAINTGTTPTSVTLPLRALIVAQSTAGAVLTLTIACQNGSTGEVCSGPITLTAARGKKVATASYSVATGSQATVTIPLNRLGKTLLAKSYKLTAKLSVVGTTALTTTVHFHYLVVKALLSFTWASNPAYTRAESLSVSAIPPGGVVNAICRGGGCPFANKRFSPSTAGNVNLEPSLKSSKLRPGTSLQLRITDTNYVGKVYTFAIHSGQLPSIIGQCLPPASKPTKCA